MEDAHTTVLDLLAGDKTAEKAHASRISFFGVFDGHGGDKVAIFAGENIHQIISKQDTFKAGNYEQALKDGFLATDRAILNGTLRDIPAVWRQTAQVAPEASILPVAAALGGRTSAL